MINMLGNDKIRKTRTGKYHWQILDDNKEIILQSFRYFKKEDDAKRHYRDVLNSLSGLLCQRYGTDDSIDSVSELKSQLESLKKEKLTAEAELVKRRKATETHKLEIQEINAKWRKCFGYYSFAMIVVGLIIIVLA